MADRTRKTSTPAGRKGTALITGAAKRLGRACALALAAEGYDLVLHYHRSRRDAAALARDVETAGRRAWLVQGDLLNPREAARAFDAAVQRAGPVDLLINNASIYEESRLGDVTPGDVLRHLNIHALSPLELSRRFAAQHRDGVIINVLDCRITGTDTGHVAYHLSKVVLESLTRLMAVEYAPRVRVNGIAPGAILAPAGTSLAHRRRVARANLLGRWGSPDDIAHAVVYLAGARFVTGDVLYVDGGYRLRR